MLNTILKDNYPSRSTFTSCIKQHLQRPEQQIQCITHPLCKRQDQCKQHRVHDVKTPTQHSNGMFPFSRSVVGSSCKTLFWFKKSKSCFCLRFHDFSSWSLRDLLGLVNVYWIKYNHERNGKHTISQSYKERGRGYAVGTIQWVHVTTLKSITNICCYGKLPIHLFP